MSTAAPAPVWSAPTPVPTKPASGSSFLPSSLKEEDIKDSRNTVFPPASTAAPKNSISTEQAKTNGKALDIATRPWSQKGRKSNRFLAAVSTCLHLGLSRGGIARHVDEHAKLKAKMKTKQSSQPRNPSPTCVSRVTWERVPLIPDESHKGSHKGRSEGSHKGRSGGSHKYKGCDRRGSAIP